MTEHAEIGTISSRDRPKTDKTVKHSMHKTGHKKESFN